MIALNALCIPSYQPPYALGRCRYAAPPVMRGVRTHNQIMHGGR